MQYEDTLSALAGLWDWCQSQPRKIYAPFVTLHTRTKPELLKKDRETGERCPYVSGVYRDASRYGQIGCNYERCTNNLLSRMANPPTNEDDEIEYFKAQELWYGKGRHVANDPFLVEHIEKHTLYVCFKPRQSVNNVNSLLTGHDKWYDSATNEEIVCPVNYLKVEKPLPAGRIPWRTISVSSILQIDCGQSYRIAA